MYAERIAEHLYRVRVPFEDLTTTVYVAIYEQGVAIIDSATYARDADHYILPALSELDIASRQIKVLALTHAHADHSGGLSRLSELFPNAEIRALEQLPYPAYRSLADGDILLGGLQVLHLPGHTRKSVGYLDLRTKTLLSGDCLQLSGIGKYRNGIGYPELYLESIEKARSMDISRIVASHEYDPLGSLAEGKEAVKTYLDTCAEIARVLLKKRGGEK